MKKIFAGLICLILMLGFTGCTVAPTVPSFTGRKAWQFIESTKTNKERMEFSAKRYSYKGLTPTEIASGNLLFELKEATASTLLNTTLSLTFNEASSYNSKVDTVSSNVVFNTNDLSPISSAKTVVRAAEQVERGYTAVTDYSENKTSIKLLGGETKEFSLKSGEYFDNEQLYHVIRSIPNLSSGTYSIKIATPYDMYNNDKFFIHNIKVTVSAELIKLNVPKNIFDMAIPREGEDTGKLDDAGDYLIDCKAVQVSLSADKSGPSFYMYLSDLKFIDNEDIRSNPANHAFAYTSNVPIKITVEEFSIASARINANEYNLTNYSTL